MRRSFPSGGPYDDRHDAPLEVERDLVHLRELGNAAVRVARFVREDRAIENTLEAGLEVAIDVRKREHVLVLA